MPENIQSPPHRFSLFVTLLVIAFVGIIFSTFSSFKLFGITKSISNIFVYRLMHCMFQYSQVISVYTAPGLACKLISRSVYLSGKHRHEYNSTGRREFDIKLFSGLIVTHWGVVTLPGCHKHKDNVLLLK